MARNDHTQPVTAISLLAARLAFAGAALFVVLLAVLHLLKPELDPSWHFVSEYAIGDYGWMMVLAFLSLALSYAALCMALRSQVRTLTGRIGLALLLVSAVGLSLGGAFVTGIVMPLAAALVSWCLVRNRAWALAREPVLWSAGLAVLGCLMSIVSLGVLLSRSGGTFGPDVMIGWPNRLEILSYTVWPMVVAWCAVRLRKGMIP